MHARLDVAEGRTGQRDRISVVSRCGRCRSPTSGPERDCRRSHPCPASGPNRPCPVPSPSDDAGVDGQDVVDIDCQPAPRRGRGSFVRNTSAPLMSSTSTARPSGVAISMPTLRLPRLNTSSRLGHSSRPGATPHAFRPRIGSPCSGCSTLMNGRLPSRIAPPHGARNQRVTARPSITRMPSPHLRHAISPRKLCSDGFVEHR